MNTKKLVQNWWEKEKRSGTFNPKHEGELHELRKELKSEYVKYLPSSLLKDMKIIKMLYPSQENDFDGKKATFLLRSRKDKKKKDKISFEISDSFYQSDSNKAKIKKEYGGLEQFFFTEGVKRLEENLKEKNLDYLDQINKDLKSAL